MNTEDVLNEFRAAGALREGHFILSSGLHSGVFLQITCRDAEDLAVPGQKYSFGIVKAAQARGDFAVLAERGRRALHIELGTDVAAGIAALDAAIRKNLA